MERADPYVARASSLWDEIDGRVVIAYPRMLSAAQRLVGRYLFPLPAHGLLTLEGEPARFWAMADGARRLDALAADLGIDPARAARFANALAARGFLALADAPLVAGARRGFAREDGWREARCRRCRTRWPVRDARWFCPRCRKLNG